MGRNPVRMYCRYSRAYSIGVLGLGPTSPQEESVGSY